MNRHLVNSEKKSELICLGQEKRFKNMNIDEYFYMLLISEHLKVFKN